MNHHPTEVLQSRSLVPRMVLLTVFLVSCFSSGFFLYGHSHASPIYNVMDFGAKAMGGDNSRAFGAAWGATCGDDGGRGAPTFYVPRGMTFKLKPISFNGPCKSNSVIVQIDGILKAPGSLAEWEASSRKTWLTFTSINNLVIKGSGSLDGQGSIWWKHSSPQTTQVEDLMNSASRPTALRLSKCNNLVLSGLHHLNSAKNHISINNVNGATISNLKIVAPSWSPNTDGIDISNSRDLHIHDLDIQTGDDCIAINSETFDLNITRITCGPGHGISVGSLGKDGESAAVGGIHVRNCTFIGAQNGARIKTFQGGSGTVRDISFEDIILDNTRNPIIIDQFYCPEHGCGTSQSNLKITSVTYRGFRGTSSRREAITLNCANIGCTGITMNSIDIRSAKPGGKVEAICKNAHGRYTDVTSPQSICLTD
ncbi:hypothetical protein MLD38_006134 [Melastoma candidum]|uniref:Uncharacterized protein n=1 Tax=Melastoma candidum TaxID=119954 RepID=A0ACB9RQN8_9MYRT|nr:hypothetical protein MLD38_006134 [Melastoma candidum]